MRLIVSFLTVSILALSLFSGCGGSDSISGTWVCQEHYLENMIGELKLELKDDGSVVMTPLNAKGSYSVKGDQVILNVTMFGSETEIELTRDGDKLVASGPMGNIVYVKK